MDLGSRLLELRKKENLSQEQLAEKMKVTRQTISKWELNETTPDIRQAQELSKIFKISLDELMDNEIKSVIVERVSNTEKLAGIIIKILKIIGILFIIYVVFLIVAVVVLSAIEREKPLKTDFAEVSLGCVIDDDFYNIIIDTKKNYVCENCTDDMNNDIKNIINFDNLDISAKNIENYFESINGTCE